MRHCLSPFVAWLGSARGFTHLICVSSFFYLLCVSSFFYLLTFVRIAYVLIAFGPSPTSTPYALVLEYGLFSIHRILVLKFVTTFFSVNILVLIRLHQVIFSPSKAFEISLLYLFTSSNS